jgi:hypothetical protein
MSDGTIQTAAQAGVRWAAGNFSMLRPDASGVVTALEKLGDTTVVALVGNPANRTEVRGTLDVTVVPEGTYRMVGTVTEAESPSLAIPGARVEVTPGALVTSTDDAGRYKLYGVPADSLLRVTADGYQPHERSLRLTGPATEDVPLTLSSPRLMIDGQYTVAIETVDPCNLSPAYRNRSYQAVATQTGTEVVVALTEPRFRLNESGRGNRFTGRVTGAVAAFTLDYFDQETLSFIAPMGYPSVVERFPDGRFLVLTGTAVLTASAGGFSGHLDGHFSVWGAGFPTNGAFLEVCYSRTHRFTLTPR